MNLSIFKDDNTLPLSIHTKIIIFHIRCCDILLKADSLSAT